MFRQGERDAERSWFSKSKSLLAAWARTMTAISSANSRLSFHASRSSYRRAPIRCGTQHVPCRTLNPSEPRTRRTQAPGTRNPAPGTDSGVGADSDFGSPLRNPVQITVSAQVDLAIHQCRRRVEAVVERIGGEHLEGRAVFEHQRRTFPSSDVDTAVGTHR